jgi:hypothetical protein
MPLVKVKVFPEFSLTRPSMSRCCLALQIDFPAIGLDSMAYGFFDFQVLVLTLNKYYLRKRAVFAVKLGMRSSKNYFWTAVAKFAT